MRVKINIEKVIINFISFIVFALGVFLFLASYFLTLEIGNPLAGFFVGFLGIGFIKLGLAVFNSIR